MTITATEPKVPGRVAGHGPTTGGEWYYNLDRVTSKDNVGARFGPTARQPALSGESNRLACYQFGFAPPSAGFVMATRYTVRARVLSGQARITRAYVRDAGGRYDQYIDLNLPIGGEYGDITFEVPASKISTSWDVDPNSVKAVVSDPDFGVGIVVTGSGNVEVDIVTGQLVVDDGADEQPPPEEGDTMEKALASLNEIAGRLESAADAIRSVVSDLTAE